MIRKVLYVIVAVLLFVTMAAAQAKPEYLDVFVVKVAPGKRAAFEAATKRIMQANRANNGDRWIALETVYGESDTISFISTRNGFADIEKGMNAFYAALGKGLGSAGTQKVFEEFGSSTAGGRSEIRMRRWDLSAAADSAGRNKIVGEARWLRTTIVHVKPGHALQFEEMARTAKAALESAKPAQVTFVAQGVAGQQGTVFYITSLQKSLADFDNVIPLPQLMGADGFRNFQTQVAEHVIKAETVINRFLPELSNPPDEVAAVAPDFWRPKPAATPARKPGTTNPQ
jgi:hypothetical protein